RRDLNRCFPGMKEGSVASRIASTIFTEIVRRSDYGIDLHTAAIRRTNFPNVRADMTDPKVASFARAFGAELIVSGRGPRGSLRRAACAAGCPTIILEAGEVWKVERFVVEYAARGIRNCLAHLNMIEGEPEQPPYRVETDRTKWVRARHGGFLHFRVGPGDILEEGQVIATNTSLTGQEQGEVISPRDGIVLGMTTLPSVSPGDPVCHLAFPSEGTLEHIERAVEQLSNDSLHERMRSDLSHGVVGEGGRD
ncbi:MAG: succinylglutamate desuccinylase/aspartoacylase family protein, partial [Phycisphaerales bacterium]|nr:succinylglutamate desuccinylase/aspartoacylase family protein [Phycisphaerales bacterium]